MIDVPRWPDGWMSLPCLLRQLSAHAEHATPSWLENSWQFLAAVTYLLVAQIAIV